MSTPGSELQTAVIKYLEKKGVLCWRNNNKPTWDAKMNNGRGGYRKFAGLRGVPDIIAITPPGVKQCGGLFVGIEIKAAKDKMSSHQILFAKRCATNNAEYHVIKKIEDIKALDYLWK